MPISRDEATALAELLCTIKPNWNIRGVIVSGLGPLAKHPAPLEVIAWAAIRAARDPEVLTPAVIPLNGPHWNLAERPATPRLTPDLECPRHVGKWAGNCPECNAEAKGIPDPEPSADETWQPPELDRAALIARAKDAARDARDRGHTPVEQDRDDASASEPQDPADDVCPSCRRSLARDVAAQGCSTPDAHPEPGSLAHHYGHPDHTAAHYEQHPERRGKSPEERIHMAQADAGARAKAKTDGELCPAEGCYWPMEDHDPVAHEKAAATP